MSCLIVIKAEVAPELNFTSFVKRRTRATHCNKDGNDPMISCSRHDFICYGLPRYQSVNCLHVMNHPPSLLEIFRTNMSLSLVLSMIRSHLEVNCWCSAASDNKIMLENIPSICKGIACGQCTLMSRVPIKGKGGVSFLDRFDIRVKGAFKTTRNMAACAILFVYLFCNYNSDTISFSYRSPD